MGRVGENYLLIAGSHGGEDLILSTFERMKAAHSNKNPIIFVADSGVIPLKTLVKKGLLPPPKLVVGDFDSVDEEDVPPEWQKKKLSCEKSVSDTEAILKILSELNPNHVVVVGDLASCENRFDHVMGLILSLSEYSKYFSLLELRSPQGVVKFIESGCQLKLHYKKNSLISLFALTKITGVTWTGVKYELLDSVLVPGTRGLSNLTVGGEMKLMINKGRGILISEL